MGGTLSKSTHSPRLPELPIIDRILGLSGTITKDFSFVGLRLFARSEEWVLGCRSCSLYVDFAHCLGSLSDFQVVVTTQERLCAGA